MKKKSIVTLLVGIALLIAGCGGQNTLSGSAQQNAPTTTATPKGNVYNQSQAVTLEADRSASVIRYTTDGSAPNSGSTAYLDPISFTTLGRTDLKFFATDSSNNRESAKTESYTVVSGHILRIIAGNTTSVLSGVKVTLTLPAGVTIPTNNDGSLAADAILASGGAYLSAQLVTLTDDAGNPSTSYDAQARTLSFILFSTATGGFPHGEFATIRCQYTGSAPSDSEFTAVLEPTDLDGNAISGATAGFHLIP